MTPTPATPTPADEDERRYPYWRRNRLTFPFANLLCGLGFNLAWPFVPLMVRDLGVRENPETWVGYMLLAFYLVSTAASPIWGGIADHYGRKLMVLRAMLGMGVTMIVVPFAPTPLWFAAALMLFAIFNGFTPAGVSLIVANTPPSRIGSAVDRGAQDCCWARHGLVSGCPRPELRQPIAARVHGRGFVPAPALRGWLAPGGHFAGQGTRAEPVKAYNPRQVQERFPSDRVFEHYGDRVFVDYGDRPALMPRCRLSLPDTRGHQCSWSGCDSGKVGATGTICQCIYGTIWMRGKTASKVTDETIRWRQRDVSKYSPAVDSKCIRWQFGSNTQRRAPLV